MVIIIKTKMIITIITIVTLLLLIIILIVIMISLWKAYFNQKIFPLDPPLPKIIFIIFWHFLNKLNKFYFHHKWVKRSVIISNKLKIRRNKETLRKSQNSIELLPNAHSPHPKQKCCPKKQKLNSSSRALPHKEPRASIPGI